VTAQHSTVDFPALRARFDADRETERQGQPGVIEARLAGALDAIGWRSAGGESSEAVAGVARHVVVSCVTGHQDPRRAIRELADLLRGATAGLDGSLPSASAFIPAGEELLRRYVGGAG
jgi:hypothetical protein